MGSAKTDAPTPISAASTTGPSSTERHTATHVGLIIVISFVFASVGLMMVLLLAMSTSTGSGWRAILMGLVSRSTIGFAIATPLLCAGSWWALQRLFRRRGWNRRTMGLTLFASWMLIATVAAFVAWGSAALLVLQFAWGGLLPLGMGFVTHGLTRREGEAPHCARCGYAFDSELEVCPECGAAWRQRGAVIAGRLHRSATMVWTGAAILVMAVLLTIRPLIGHVLAPLVPTSLLIAQASGQDVWSGQDWAELASRQLSPEQEQTLAEGLLDRRWKTGRLDPAPAVWLERQLIGGTMDDATRSRFFEEMVVLHLRGPKEARVGEPVRIEALADDRSTPFAGIGSRVYFAGFDVDGKPVADSRLPRKTSVYDFDEWTVRRKPGEELPHVVLRPERAGVVKVEMEAWIVYGPEALLGWGSAWNDDGTPAVPAGVLWVEHVQRTQEIQVRE